MRCDHSEQPRVASHHYASRHYGPSAWQYRIKYHMKSQGAMLGAALVMARLRYWPHIHDLFLEIH